MSKPEPRRVSASRLTTLDDCTMLFYFSEVLKLPQKVWERTSAGTVTHAILDPLAKDKHRHHHDAIKAANTITASPAVVRLFNMWVSRLNIGPNISVDIDAMCMVAINQSNFLDEGAVRRFEPEHEFKMTLRNGAVVKGFIDRLAQMPNGFIIKDYKTAKDKHTKAKVLASFQSLVYQLYVWKTFGALAEVHYYFLRHPPSKFAKNKHLMITPPATPAMLAGFETYLEYMYQVINNFGQEEAHSKLHSDSGFCQNVCSFRRPFDYISVRKRATGDLVGNFALDKVPQIGEDEVSERRHFDGCPRFNSTS